MARVLQQYAVESVPLDAAWQLVSLPPQPVGTALPEAEYCWRDAAVPGVVAGADDPLGRDHWYRLDRLLPGGATLRFDGLAGPAEIWADGALLAGAESMFRALEVTLPPRGVARLQLCFRALRPRLARRLPGRGGRWRGRLADGESLRGQRVTLLGHMPGWDGGVAVVGPYRPVTLRLPAAGPVVLHADLRTAVVDGTGEIAVRLHGTGLAGCDARLCAGGRSVALQPDGEALCGVLHLPRVRRWWPHTHGEPALYEVGVLLDGGRVELGKVGFRSIRRRPGAGFGLLVNDVPVFCRGAVVTGEDFSPATLERLRGSGLNMLRVTGMGHYAGPALLDACDALGILVWHDFMFARFDYPAGDEFLAAARGEAEEFLADSQAHPCLAVLCGGTEVLQAAAMAGRPEAEWAMPLFDTVLADAAAALRPDIPYLPHAPGGGALPFAAAAPVAHYFGVGGYLRPLSDLESAGVNFAAECLAFANPPDPAACRALGGIPGDPAWKARVPRDPGSAWDFEDVRDHYVASLFRRDPAGLRRDDPAAWLAHGRAAVALAIEQALGVWRTDGVCAGALLLMLQDRAPGAGWGLLGHDGRAKSAWHAWRRASAARQVVLRDGGQNGVVLHAINDTPAAQEWHLHLRGLAPDGTVEPLGSAALRVPAHGAVATPALALTGRWRDLAHAWRFGPAAFAALGATLSDGTAMLSESTLFPTGPALATLDPGLRAELRGGAAGWQLVIASQGFAQFIQIDDEHYMAEDELFHLWPGETRTVALRRPGDHARPPEGVVTALNGRVAARYGAGA